VVVEVHLVWCPLPQSDNLQLWQVRPHIRNIYGIEVLLCEIQSEPEATVGPDDVGTYHLVSTVAVEVGDPRPAVRKRGEIVATPELGRVEAVVS
jgi:hypothetical protein